MHKFHFGEKSRIQKKRQHYCDVFVSDEHQQNVSYVIQTTFHLDLPLRRLFHRISVFQFIQCISRFPFFILSNDIHILYYISVVGDAVTFFRQHTLLLQLCQFNLSILFLAREREREYRIFLSTKLYASISLAHIFLKM